MNREQATAALQPHLKARVGAVMRRNSEATEAICILASPGADWTLSQYRELLCTLDESNQTVAEFLALND